MLKLMREYYSSNWRAIEDEIAMNSLDTEEYKKEKTKLVQLMLKLKNEGAKTERILTSKWSRP